MMRLILVRHGETVENSARIVQGQMPGVLSGRGRQQAQAVGEALRRRRIDAAYSSDLARAWDTAMIIGAVLPSVRLTAEPGLREQHLGRYEGGPTSVLMRRLKETGGKFDPEGGEPSTAFRSRVRCTMDKLSAAHPDETVLVITHHGFIWTFLDEYAGGIGYDRRMPTKSGTATFATLEGPSVVRMQSLDCLAFIGGY